MSDTGLISRDIWTHGGGWPLPDLLRSALSSLIIHREAFNHIYFASPWITDFDLFDNRFKAYEGIIPRLSSTSKIRFSDYLVELSSFCEIRLLSTDNKYTNGFFSNEKISKSSNIKKKYGEKKFHEKGIISPFFYFEGSMNITYSGVRVRGEKVVYHVNATEKTSLKIANALLELDRHWANLEDAS
jgi:hypothetical protein